MFPWIPFLSYIVAATATPGPNNVMSMSNGNRFGFRKGLPFNFGILTGWCLISLLCTAFCSVLAVYIPMIKIPMLCIGAAYMLYLAIKLLRSNGEIQDAASSHGYIAGLLLQFVNPKLYICIIVAIEGYMLPYYAGEPIPLILLALLMGMIGGGFTFCWSAFGSIFRRIFAKHARIINTIMALLLIYCAVSLFI